MRENRLHRQGLYGCSQKTLVVLKSESRSPNKRCTMAHENRRNGGYMRSRARLTLKIGQSGREGPPDAYTRSLRTSRKKCDIFDLKIRITKKLVCYST